MNENEASQTIKPPIIWRMEPYLSNLIHLSGERSPEVAIKLNLAIIAFNRKCAVAEIDLYDEVQKLLG